ncbi:myocyte-specific enhancer factor 2A-like isoform X1 [Electrophorus electricus]|uniref:myocyte-specific enhancer factor 2A-like isoform X1 n=1 Tax=Electrophorus electricus TaxID=8005 RepID=UPI0015D09DAE|nr:myocyte-specific enhancer factor 2A-like isoform X1 [Electrophorus electricus]
MGRKKIQIARIVEERNRQVTFTKRKFGLMKKAYELSVLCDCEIALIIFNSSNKLFQYASTDMDKVLLKYTEYSEPHESRTNGDIMEALHKKEQRGCESPEADASSYILTPHTEEKYQKINEEFDNMMRNHKLANCADVLAQHSFSVSASVPVNEPYARGSLAHTQTLPSPTSNLDEATMLSPIPSAVQPAPTTGLAGCTQGPSDPTLNGVHSGSIVNGLAGTQRENSTGGGLPAKSPAPPTGSLALVGHKPELRLLLPPACKSNAQTLQSEEGEGDSRINSPQSNQSLTTPVVSMASPSLPQQGMPYTAMTSAYDSDYSLSSSELSNLHGFNLPESLTLASGPSWQHIQLVQSAPTSQGASRHAVQVSKRSSSPSPVINIKAEPASPPGEPHTPLAFLALLPPSSRQEAGRSPAESLSSSCSSYEGSDREEQRRDLNPPMPVPGQARPLTGLETSGGPSLKRLRMDTWVT